MNQEAQQPDSATALDDVVSQLKNLPTLPAVAQEMLSNLQDEEGSLDAIIETVALDQAIAAKILRLANSSYYGTNSKVVTLHQAVSLLGVKNVKNLVRMTILTNSFQESNCPAFDFKAFWRHSIATAICAELISRRLHMKHDFAFTAGLLHDIGRLVLVTLYPERYGEVLAYREKHDCPLLEAERAVMEIDHTIAGQALAKHWRFSDAISDAIFGHHAPEIAGLNSLVSIVHVANVIVHALDLASEENDQLPLLSQTAWDTLALTETDYLAIFHETESRFESLDQIVF